MRSITLLSIPPQAESPQRGVVWGADIAKTGFVKALLSHGTSERYYFLCERPDKLGEAEAQLTSYKHNERAEVVLLRDYWRLKDIDSMVIFNTDPMLHPQAGLRRVHGQIRWPVNGVTYSLSHTTHLPYTIQTILSDIFEYDSLVCISQAGRRAVENIIGSICGYLERKYRASFLPKFQLPVIPLGIDAEAFQPSDKTEARRRCGLPDDRVIFLYFGRFSAHYKADLFPLVLAFSRILKSGGDKKMTLVLAGSDARYELVPALKRFRDDLGLGDNLVLLPNINKEKKPDLYQAADVFVSLSDNVQETFGIAIIEAMCAGLPVIASDWDGYRESMRHGETGFLVPVYWANGIDLVSRSAILEEPMETHRQLAQTVCVDLQKLTDYMMLLSNDASLRRDMGAAARKRALSYYDWPVVVGAYEELWDDMIKKGQTSPAQEEPGHGVYTYDYLDVYKHFATGIVTRDSNLTVGPMGRDVLEGVLDIDVLRHTELIENLPLVNEVLGACNSEDGINASDLVRRMAGESEPAATETFRRIASLIKYGLVDATIPDVDD
jgi:D-inositol-3-phosphate glycosyltransferase